MLMLTEWIMMHFYLILNNSLWLTTCDKGLSGFPELIWVWCDPPVVAATANYPEQK